MQSAGLLSVPIYADSSDIVFVGGAVAISIHILDRGSSGNLAVYEGVDNSGVMRYPSTPYTSLTNGQIIRFSDSGSSFVNMYLTLPTNAIVLVYIAPR